MFKIMVDVASDSFVMLDQCSEIFLNIFQNMQQQKKKPKYIANIDVHKYIFS